MKILKKILNYLDDICYFFGAACVTYAAHFVHAGLAWFSAGVFFLIFSVMLGKAMR